MGKTKKSVKQVAQKPAKKKATKPKAEKLEKGLVVVHSPVNPTQEFIVASEFADDEAIEAELMGKAMEHYVYSFPQEGKTVTGLTVAGVNEMSRQLTKKKDSGIKIRVVPDSVKIERDVEEGGEKGISVILMAENMLTGETAIGAKFEPYQKTGRKGKYANSFALEKAVSKAERNAKRKLIPEKVAIEMIKKFVKSGSVQNLNNQLPPAPVQSRPIEGQVVNGGVNYLVKLIAMLAKEADVKITANSTKADYEKLVDVYNRYTGSDIKSLKVSQSTAEKYLMEFVNSPIMINKK